MTRKKIDTSLLTRLERDFGLSKSYVVSDLSVLRLGIVEITEDPENTVAIVESVGEVWREVARFEWFTDAFRAMGRILDLHWDEIPVDEVQEPSPTLISARERSLEVIYRTTNGVWDAEELFENPGELIPFDQHWPDFTTATSWLADAEEYWG
jgi:hypothetical protein